MKSPAKKQKIDDLVLPWDPDAPTAEQVEMRAGPRVRDPRFLDDYFEFLELFKPSRRELTEVKIYGEPFTLQ